MSEARSLSMADVMAEFYDGPHATPPPADDGPIYLGIRNITDGGRLDLSDVRHISEQHFGKWTKRVMPRPGDIVFTYEATLHRYALIPEGFRGCLGRRLALIRPDTAIVDPAFLHLYMLGPQWRAVVEDRIISGSTVDRIPIIDFPRFPIELPPLGTQRRVAAILSAFDELIAVNGRRIELLEDLARSLYRDWFVHFRFPGHAHVEFVDSELGPIPERWELRPVVGMASKQRHAVSSGPFGSKLGRKDYRDGGVPVIRGTNLDLGGGFHDDGFVFVAPEKADELAASIARPGDIVVTQRGTLGQVGLVPSNAVFDRYVISQSQMKITVDPAVGSSQYLYFVLRSPEATQRILNMAISTGVPHINLAMLREMPVVCPPRELQHEFEKLVAPTIELIEQHQCTIAGLVSTRDLLLPRLVTGKLDISDLDLGDLLPPEAA